MRKIGVLTQPLHDNYGGLLQAYALKETLQGLGHEVVIVNRRNRKVSDLKRKLTVIKRKIFNQRIPSKLYLTDNQKKTVSQNTVAFQKKYIPNLSRLIMDDEGMEKLKSEGFNAYVVGSDQCWRPRYSPKITNYFLDFVKDEIGIKRISYAASFGVSEWEFNADDTQVCSNLLQKFDAVSVREESAVNLVKKYLGRDSVHVIDPTMLLTKDDYMKMCLEERAQQNPGELKVYVLDKTKSKLDFVNRIESKLGIRQFQVLPVKSLNEDLKIDDISDFVYPSPIQWLQGYNDARFVITDSFHGTVFSILFNIPFIAVANKSRGVARFESLLRMFGLENRLVFDVEEFDVESVLQNNIDWDSVNGVLNIQRKKAIDFLRANLS